MLRRLSLLCDEDPETIMNDDHPEFHDQLFQACLQVSPYLVGSIGKPNDANLQGGQDNAAFFSELYQNIAESSPEAGHSYWLSRTWDVSVWQPVYIAFISVYGFHTAPNFTQFSQQRNGDYVAGFHFFNHEHQHASIPDLITIVGKQLAHLLEDYRHQIDRLYRCRPGFVRHLLVDLIISCCIRASKIIPNFTQQQIKQHAQLWLTALDLPTERIDAIYQQEHDIYYPRKSCCLVYKTKSGQLCADCPRHYKNKEQMHVSIVAN